VGMFKGSGLNQGMGFSSVESGWPLYTSLTGIVESVLKEGGGGSSAGGGFRASWRRIFVWMWQG